MHRIDTPTAQKDKFGAGKNGFTRGNPQTGTPATDLDDDYFDMLQEELAGIVEASSTTLDKAKRNQLLTALKLIFPDMSSFTKSLAANGYQRLPGGLIIQWGLSASTTTTNIAMTFPIAFPNANLYIGENDKGGSTQRSLWGFSTPTLTGVTAYNLGKVLQGNTTVVAPTAATCCWIAIGY